MEESYEEFSGCIIKKMVGDLWTTYTIMHKLSRNTIHTSNEISAYKIAKLLELEYVVTKWAED